MPHKPQLDGLRFLVFLAVFFFHAQPGRYSWGPQGVQVFFTLSGFLITRILILGESGNLGADLKRFYIRRTLRIFPLYYAVVAWLWATGWLTGVAWYLGYLYNVRVYLTGGWGGPVGHFWTLCVEEQFYLGFPVALLLTRPRWRLAMVLGLIVGSKVFQVYAHSRLAIPWATFLLPYCGEHLLWGAIAGMLDLRIPPGKRDGPTALVAGVLLMVLTRARPEWGAQPPSTALVLGSFSGFGIGSSLLVFGLWRTKSPWVVRPMAWRPVAYLGRISYGLYVYHLIVIERHWETLIPEHYLIPEPYGALLVTIAVASASWFFLEEPILQLKDRLTRRPGDVVPWPVPWYVARVRRGIRGSVD